MDLKKININQLTPAEYNPRVMKTEQRDKLKKGIETFGLIDPIIIDLSDNNTIIGGHQRASILKELDPNGELYLIELGDVGLVIKEKELHIQTKNDQKAMNISLNNPNLMGEFTEELPQILLELYEEDYPYEVTGFDESDFQFTELIDEDISLHDITDDEYSINEEKVITTIKNGDMYKLGEHYLLCGDSTKKEDIQRVCGSTEIHMLFTDPPWNVNYGGTTNPSWKQRKIINDNLSEKEFSEFLHTTFKNVYEILPQGAMVYIVMSAKEWGPLMQILEKLHYHWSSTIIWNKHQMVLSRKDYHTKYEPIWYGWTEGTRIHPLTDRTQSDVWDFERPHRSDEHPTMKPVPLVAQAILNSTNIGDNILDIFGGSGTTLLAAEQTQRNCYMIEKDPTYCQTIINRWEEYTGKIATQI